MVRRHRLRLTDEIQRCLGRVERATALYPNADDGVAPLDREKVALADAVVHAVAEQTAARLRRLPARAPLIPVRVRIARRHKRGA